MNLKPGLEVSRSLENFRGDFEGLAALMEQSWAENKNRSLLYTSEYLRSCFAYPGAGFPLAPTIYLGARPVAFAAGFPRKVRFQGRAYDLLTITFLTVASEYKKMGFGIIVWSELVKRARAAGFDGMMNYCLDGEAMDGMILGSCRRLNLPVERIGRINFLAGILKPPSGNADLAPDNIETFLKAANQIAERIPLARLWSPEDVEWLFAKAGAVVAHHRAGTRKGWLTGYILPAGDPARTKCLVVEDIIWGDLTASERTALIGKFLGQAAAAGARLATVPVLGYADTQPFKEARFRTSRRLINAYLSIWKDGAPVLEPLSSFYSDVF